MNKKSYSQYGLSVLLALAVVLSGNMAFAGNRSSSSSKSSVSRGSGGSRVSASSTRSSRSASSTRSGSRTSGNRGSSPTRVKGSATHRRGGHGSHRRGHSYRHYSSYLYPFYGGPYYGLGYYGGLFSYYGPYFGFSYRGGYGDGYYDGRDYQTGALDLNVKPKKTGVYLDGQYIGTTGSYDGYPRHLWVAEGLHELTFYLEGYRNETRRIRVQRGAMIDLNFRMQPGEAVMPQERAPRIDPEMELESRREWSRDSYSRGSGEDQTIRDRSTIEESARSSDRDLRTDPGRIRINIEPADATVYIDGRFVGTGGDLSSLHSGLILEAGKHKLDVVRPGFDGKTVDFLLEAASEIDLEVILTSKDRGEEL